METTYVCWQMNRWGKCATETSLIVQWWKLHATNAEGVGSIPGGGTKISHATGHGQRIKRWKNRKCEILSALIGALGRPRGLGWGGRWKGVSGWGTHVNPWLIHVNVWQKPLQYCKIISLQLIKINEKKKSSHFQQYGWAWVGVLNETIRQRKINTAWYHLYVEPRKKKVKLIETEWKSDCQRPEEREMGRIW